VSGTDCATVACGGYQPSCRYELAIIPLPASLQKSRQANVAPTPKQNATRTRRCEERLRNSSRSTDGCSSRDFAGRRADRDALVGGQSYLVRANSPDRPGQAAGTVAAGRLLLVGTVVRCTLVAGHTETVSPGRPHLHRISTRLGGVNPRPDRHRHKSPAKHGCYWGISRPRRWRKLGELPRRPGESHPERAFINIHHRGLWPQQLAVASDQHLNAHLEGLLHLQVQLCITVWTDDCS
jgi:hypothetical protein